MGRPIKAVYFGAPKGTGVGGEGVQYANVWIAGEGYYTANVGVTFSAPQIAGGTTAAGTVTLDGNGNVTAIAITTIGSGYTSAPTASITGANASPATANVSLYAGTTTADAIYANAWVTGGSMGKVADVVTQRSSRRYRVTNADGTSVCRLVPNAPATRGEMSLNATDSDGGTYWVTKLESRTACLIPNTGTQFSANAHVSWNIGSPEEDVSVTIDNR